MMQIMMMVAAAMIAGHGAPMASPANGMPQVRASWAPADSADALWKKGRSAIADGKWEDAQDLFRQIHEQYARSAYAGDSYYWEAYALSKLGDGQSLRRAVRMLDVQAQRFAQAATYKSGEAKALSTRLTGILARNGDADAAQSIASTASSYGSSSGAGRSYGASAGASSRSNSASGCKDDDNDDRVAALNALLQMGSEQALPLLKRVMARREPCSEVLRRKAVFMISQKESNEAADILMDAARNDPDAEVRRQAVFFLSQVSGEKAITLLEDILKSSKDEDLQEQSIFALSQRREERAQQTLRSYASRDDVPDRLRDKAIFWIGQQPSAANAQLLRDLFAKTANGKMQGQLLFAISQMKGYGNLDWLLDQAVNPKLTIEVRKNALFAAGQAGLDASRLAIIYDKGGDEDFRKQVIFVLSQQQSSPGAIEKLIWIAKEEKNSVLRKQAIFWLGQSRDPRALKAIQEIIDR